MGEALIMPLIFLEKRFQFFVCDRVATKQHPELAKLNVLRSCNFTTPTGVVNHFENKYIFYFQTFYNISSGM